MGMNIQDWRAEIDIIDSELLCLLNRRAQLAIEIGALKRRDDAPLYDPARERQVLVRALTTNSGPLDDEAVTKIFRCIIDESRRVEEVTTEPHLDRVSIGSGSDLVQPSESKILCEYCMPITDQVATAPCTDPIQQ